MDRYHTDPLINDLLKRARADRDAAMRAAARSAAAWISERVRMALARTFLPFGARQPRVP